MRSGLLLLAVAWLVSLATAQKPKVMFLEGLEGVEWDAIDTTKYDRVSVTAEVQGSMLQADYEKYAAIVVSNTKCSETSADISRMLSSRFRWAPAVKGNIVIIGTETSGFGSGPEGAQTFIKNSLDYALQGPFTGLYLTLSCYYSKIQSTAPSTLGFLGPLGTFQAYGTGASCADVARVVDPSSPVMKDQTHASLSNWGCSIRELIVAPADFKPVALLYGPGPSTGSPGAIDIGNNIHGVPYIYTKDALCGNSVVDSGEKCDEGALNGQPGSLCSDRCQCIFGAGTQAGTCSSCGNGQKDAGEDCDDGVDLNGGPNSLCSKSCRCLYGPGTQAGTCSSCGNGKREGTEQCDIGARNGLQGSNCTATCECVWGFDSTSNSCKPDPVCGNSVTESLAGEECDSGENNGKAGDECTKRCKCVRGFNNDTLSCNPPPCGNSVYEPEEEEECDHGSLNGAPGDLCSSSCKCVHGVDNADLGTCLEEDEDGTTTTTPKPTGSTTSKPNTSGPGTDGPGTTEPGLSTLPTQTQTSGGPGSTPPGSPTGPTPTGTEGPLPSVVGQFTVLGCHGSGQGYDTFVFAGSSDDMNLELCTSLCVNRALAGAFSTDCYCGDALSDVFEVPGGLCSIPCPGDPTQHCGGYRDASGRVRRQAVPNNILLSLYANNEVAPIDDPSTSTSQTLDPLPSRTDTGSNGNPTSPPPDGGSGQGGGQGQGGDQSGNGSGGQSGTTCVNGYCSGGYVFDLCIGAPGPDEIVFVREACSCAGGWGYVPAACRGEACVGTDVYRAVPYDGAGEDADVYTPSACDSCNGGVQFTQPETESDTTPPPPAPAPAEPETPTKPKGPSLTPLPPAASRTGASSSPPPAVATGGAQIIVALSFNTIAALLGGFAFLL